MAVSRGRVRRRGGGVRLTPRNISSLRYLNVLSQIRFKESKVSAAVHFLSGGSVGRVCRVGLSGGFVRGSSARGSIH